MNVLGLFGTIGKAVLGVTAGVVSGGAAPGIIAALPSIIQLVERILPHKENQPATGTAKHDAVVSIVKEMILTAEGVSGKDIVDEVAFTDGLNQAIEGIVKVLNATAWKAAPKTI